MLTDELTESSRSANNTSVFLDPNDVERLTGYKRYSAQSRWLRTHGFAHEVNALGHPIVILSAVAQKLVPKRMGRAKPNLRAATNG